MDKDHLPTLKTRASLLERLRDWEDQVSWQEFFNAYWKLIYGAARRAGLSDDEAQEVVQETLISVARSIGGFQYDSTRGTFKGWLLNLTRWRISDLLRRRGRIPAPGPANLDGQSATDAIREIPDPASLVPDQVWELDWQKHLLEAGLARIRAKVDPLKYQLFDFYANKGWTPQKVAERFGVSVAVVYMTKHRIAEQLKDEIERLEKGAT